VEGLDSLVLYDVRREKKAIAAAEPTKSIQGGGAKPAQLITRLHPRIRGRRRGSRRRKKPCGKGKPGRNWKKVHKHSQASGRRAGRRT